MLLAATIGGFARAATTRQVIPFQGAVAVKPGMTPLDDQPYGGKFQIYTQASGGALLFEDIQDLTIVNGTFAVELGGGATPLGPDLPRQNADLWLQITLDLDRSGTYDGAETMTPRLHLGSALTALHSQRAETAAAAETLTLPATLRDGNGLPAIGLQADGALMSEKNLGDTAPPRRGALYRDSACLAWGLIDGNNATLIAGFGINTVAFDGNTYEYRIDLRNDTEMAGAEPEYTVAVAPVDFQQRAEFAIYNPISATRIGVTIFGLDIASANNDGSLNIPRVKSNFSIMVFGRPK
jgi:hypothetical protein